MGTGADAATRGHSPQAYLCARAAGALGQPLPRPGGCGRCLGGGAPARAALGLRADALPRSAAARGGGAGDSSAPRPPELSDPAGARAERPVAGSTLSACAPGLAQVRGVCPGPRGPPGPTGVRTGRGAWRGGMLRAGSERHGDARRRRSLGARLATGSHAPLSLQQRSGWGEVRSPSRGANLARGEEGRRGGGGRVTYWPSGLKLFLEMLATKYWLCGCVQLWAGGQHGTASAWAQGFAARCEPARLVRRGGARLPPTARPG